MQLHYVNKSQIVEESETKCIVYNPNSDVGIVFEGEDAIKQSISFITGQYISLHEYFTLSFKSKGISLASKSLNLK